ncbi:MAG: hypothetical protein LBK44_00250, partial [Spirochaetales bacterium]|nr:hypothetical protein [Spirochaetales bacterium]
HTRRRLFEYANQGGSLPVIISGSGRLPAERRGRAFRCKSSELPMQFLWAFRYNPWRMAAKRYRKSKPEKPHRN